jgi:lipopolysaccharide exporter
LAAIFKESKFASYWSSVASIFGAGLIIQILNFIFIPIIARFYGPDLMGHFSVINALAGIIVPISCLRYDFALPLINSDRSANKYLTLLLKLGIAVGASLTTTLLILAFFDIIKIGPLRFFLYISVFLGVIINCMSLWATRLSAFTSINIYKLFTALFNGLIVIILAYFFNGNSKWLVFGYTVSNIIGLLIMYCYLAKKKLAPKWIHSSKSKILEFANRFSDFPKYNLPLTIVDQISAGLPMIVVFNFFGDIVSGQFGMCNSILRVPIALLGASIAQAFFAKAKNMLETPIQLKQLFLQNITLLSLIAFSKVLVIIFFGPALFSFVMGENWKTSGEIAKIMVWATAGILIYSPTSILPTLLKLQKTHFLITLCFSILKTVMLFFGCWFGDFKFALIIYVLAELLGLGTYMIWIVIKLKHL